MREGIAIDDEERPARLRLHRPPLRLRFGAFHRHSYYRSFPRKRESR
jgi:hypothetical protein